jgi:O-antigen/teichoic acid export membrane protein
VGLAWVLTIATAVSVLMYGLLAALMGAPGKLAVRLVRWRTFVELFRFGSWAFLQTFGLRLISYTDAVVIGIVLDMKSIAYFSIGMMLSDYGCDFVSHIFRVVVPDTTQAAGANNLPLLRWYVLRSTRVSMVVAIPLFVGMMALGEPFIRLWMGPEFQSSAWILIILTASSLAGVARWAITSTVQAMGHVRATAVIALGESVMKLGLSILLATLIPWGIYGVALGTSIPAMTYGLAATLLQSRRFMGLPLRMFHEEVLLPSLVTSLLFGGVCVLALLAVPMRSWSALFLTAGALAVLYLPIAWFCLLPAAERLAMRQGLRLRLGLGRAADDRVGVAP